MLILGIDPSKKYMPKYYENNGIINLEQWGCDMIDIASNGCLGVKFQSAYFESYGLHGLIALSKLIKYAKSKQLIVIMDAKRGDIGSTSTAYATAFLAKQNDGGNSDFESDYLTINPLMGEDCIQPFIDIANENRKGVFVLLETSNPGASMILSETYKENKQINEKIADFIQGQHQTMGIKENEFGPIGCVIGATNSSGKFWRERLPNSIFLMPGIGAQGGDWKNIELSLNASGNGVWIPISRGITMPENANISSDNYLNNVHENMNKYIDEISMNLG